MKRINFRPLAGVFLAGLVFTSCASLNKMKKNADKINYDVTPEILEAHGNEVDVAVQGRIPESYFVKKAELTATPVLVFEGGEKAYESYKLQGESVDGNAKSISYANGGSFSYKGTVPFEEGMRDADLEVRITASKGSKSVVFDPIKIADGTIATSTLVSNTPSSIIGVQREKNTTGKYNPATDKFQRIVPDEYKADLVYMINQSNVRYSEMRKNDLKQLTEYVIAADAAERKELKGIEVSAYASPDGETDFNDKLAQRREGTASKYMNKTLKKSKVETELSKRYTAEDWEGFQELMKASSIQDKELILRVLSMYSDPEVREREIKNLAATYKTVADEILPQLRRAKLTASVDVIGKTDAEILAAADSNPASLNQAELIYASTLTEDLNKQKAYNTAFTKQFSNDWRGFNNLGMVELKQGNDAAAEKNFKKADQLSANNPIVQNNLGAIELRKGNVEAAEKLFGAASGAGDAVKGNLGIVSIKKGEYDAAVKYFGSCPCANSALASMLAGDNNGALRKLNANESGDAMVDYLKAVIGARTAKSSLLYSSLEAAVKKDASYKALAASDLEFAKYFEEAKFTSIVK